MTVKTKVIVFVISLCFVFLTALIAWGNKAVELNCCTIESSCLPESFDGYKIIHISDLHNAKIGKDNEGLLTLIEKAEPDIIAITGDLVDSRRTNVETALRFIEKVTDIAPCFYVTGNHESRIEECDYLLSEMAKMSVVILRDEKVLTEKDGEYIAVVGVDDPYFERDGIYCNEEAVIRKELYFLLKEEEHFTLILSHRPELFHVYADYGVNLVLSGHAHGGQFRLPFLGGLYAPHQGILPEYDNGVYTKDSTTMVVSRGIGNSAFPFRLNNRPEVIFIELKKEV